MEPALKPDHNGPFTIDDSPPAIWLEPRCAPADEGQQWCQDDVWGECETCHSPAVKYIRADLATRPQWQGEAVAWGVPIAATGNVAASLLLYDVDEKAEAERDAVTRKSFVMPLYATPSAPAQEIEGLVEPVAWRQWARVTRKGGMVQRRELLTACLPFSPDADDDLLKVALLGEPEPLCLASALARMAGELRAMKDAEEWRRGSYKDMVGISYKYEAAARAAEARASALAAEVERLNEIIARLDADLSRAEEVNAAAEASLAEAQADKKRLAFLDACNARLNERSGTTYRWELILNHNVNRLMLGHMEVDLNDAAANGLPSCRDVLDREIDRVEASRKARLEALGREGEGK